MPGRDRSNKTLQVLPGDARVRDHHRPFLSVVADLSGRLARWVFKLQAFKFSISHRKGKDHVVPDALSRISSAEISGIELSEPEIDLDSESFEDFDYLELKSKIVGNESKYPDVKILGKYVYIRTEHYTGEEQQEQQAWKLWISKRLRRSV